MGNRGVLAAICLWLVGCGCKPENLCPPYFQVNDWCMRTGKCQLDGAPTCVAGSDPACFTIPRGKVFRIPVSGFASSLGSRRQLSIAVYAAGAGADSSKLVARLDGAPGVPLAPLYTLDDSGAFPDGDRPFGWDPFPSSPMFLEVSHDDAGLAVAEILIAFYDYACRQQHPPRICAV